ncbi:hypothetical protein [Nonomuraea candida]|uniref:hypothetical protein n=1 Tax=Nonomuraea candida TaxID=359159 RepID=UPI000A00887D|nr:hypothetical protein [Nonomuraea candida]
MTERLRGESETADTVVVGSRGLGGFAGLVLGSVGLGLAACAVACRRSGAGLGQGLSELLLAHARPPGDVGLACPLVQLRLGGLAAGGGRAGPARDGQRAQLLLPARVEFARPVTKLRLDDQWYGAVGGGLTQATHGGDAPGYEVIVAGGADTVTVVAA